MGVLRLAAVDGGEYQATITHPYGSVTSVLANVTVLLPPVIVIYAPAISINNVLLDFNLSQGTNTSFTRLQSSTIIRPWTTNTAATSPPR